MKNVIMGTKKDKIMVQATTFITPSSKQIFLVVVCSLLFSSHVSAMATVRKSTNGDQQSVAIAKKSKANPSLLAKKRESIFPHGCLGPLQISGSRHDGRFLTLIVDQCTLELAKTRRTWAGRIVYARSPLCFVTNLAKSARCLFEQPKVPLICVTPAENSETDDVKTKKAPQCLDHLYAMLFERFWEFKHCSPSRCIAWEAYCLAILKAHAQGQRSTHRKRLLKYAWKTTGAQFNSHEPQDKVLRNIIKVLYTCSSDFRELTGETVTEFTEMLHAYYYDYLSKEGVSLDEVCDCLRQYPAAQEIFACVSLPKTPRGYVREAQIYPVDDDVVVVHTKNGFLAV